MIPAPIIEWAVWANLDKLNNPELILLKGHLLLDIILEAHLVRTISTHDVAASDLSFFRKLTLLERDIKPGDRCSLAAIQYARHLNSLRNKLAHEYVSDNTIAELNEWAQQVLNLLPSTKFQRHTTRTAITQAFAALAKSLYGGVDADDIL